VWRDSWDKSRERFEAFWNRELVDRCCIAVKSLRDDAPPAVEEKSPVTRDELLRYWLDPEDNLRRIRAGVARVFCGGEAFPAATMCLGASAMAAFYGAGVEYRPDTVWYHPVLKDLERADWNIDLERAPLYRETMATARYYAAESHGEFMVSLPELGSATDNLSLLRGIQELVLDMIDCPEFVEQGIGALVETWATVHRQLYEVAQEASRGGCCIQWMGTWAPGPHYQMSCDFSAVLSPDLFRRFIVPEIERYLDVNTYGVYHWDGPDALKHLDALLEIPRLRAIQWTPGEGQPPTSSARWLPYFRRIQDAGKCLVLPIVNAHEVETLLSTLSSRGLFLKVWAPSEQAAKKLVEEVPKWTLK
jgi:hypothetical protein